MIEMLIYTEIFIIFFVSMYFILATLIYLYLKSKILINSMYFYFHKCKNKILYKKAKIVPLELAKVTNEPVNSCVNVIYTENVLVI